MSSVSIPQEASPNSPDLASRAAALSVISNACLMVLKVSVGLMFGSVAVLGDGVDSAEDLLASGLALFTVRLALQPADEAHPYGHGKAESLSALSQAALIGGAAAFIAFTAIRRALADDVDVHVGPSLITMGVAAATNLGVAAYSMRAARLTGSVAIAADARHLMTNVVQALAVATGLALVGITGKDVFDPLLALLLSAYLAWVAFGMLRSASHELLDSSLPDETLLQIRTCLAHESHQMLGYHDLRTRKSGREILVDVHVLVDPDLTVANAHALTDHLEADLLSVIPGALVTLHVDPAPRAESPPLSASP
jgi:cation diffusion facilitator family transporter